MIDDLRPDVVAIDSPPRWAATGRSRRTERELAACNIQSFNTPRTPRARQRVLRVDGGRVRGVPAANEQGYPTYGGGSPRRRAMEVFPHATAMVLAGTLAAERRHEARVARARPARAGRAHRRAHLDRSDRRGARRADGAPGPRREAVRARRPARRRDHAPGELAPGQAVPAGGPTARRRGPALQLLCVRRPGLPGAGARGVRAGARREAQGDALAARARGTGAIEELEERGWKLPPEMR